VSTDPKRPISAGAREFHLSEYGHLREEFLKVLSFAEKLLPSTILFSTGFYAWMITTRKADSVLFNCEVWHSLLLIPMIATLYSAVLGFAAYQKIQTIGGYLYLVEIALGSQALGWEKYVNRTKRTRIGLPKNSRVGGVTFQVFLASISWALLFVLNILAISLLWSPW
jgi:hypothetical protein